MTLVRTMREQFFESPSLRLGAQMSTTPSKQPPADVRACDGMFRVERLVGAAEDGTILRLHGEMDAGADRDIDTVLGLTREDGPIVTVDLRAVRFIDSTGIRVIMRTARMAQQQGIALRIVRGNRSVQRVFEILCLDTVLPFVDA
jgi:anti-sigma B factor antagonist